MKVLKRRVCVAVVFLLLLHFVLASAASVLVNHLRPEGCKHEIRCDTGLGITMPHGRLSLTTLKLKIKAAMSQLAPVMHTPIRLLPVVALLLFVLAVVCTPLPLRVFILRHIRPPNAGPNLRQKINRLPWNRETAEDLYFYSFSAPQI